jgi:hypothetical protein
MPRKTEHPDIEAGAVVKAKKLRSKGGPTEYDVERRWYTQANVEVRSADEVRTTRRRNPS